MIVVRGPYEYKNLMKFHKPEEPFPTGEGAQSSVFQGIPEAKIMDGQQPVGASKTLFAHCCKTF